MPCSLRCTGASGRQGWHVAERTVDLWDIALPLGTRQTRTVPTTGSRPEHLVMLARNTDARPVRVWEWSRDGATDMESLRLRELWRTTAGAAPLCLWLPRRNACAWSDDIPRGYLNGSPRVGWASTVPAGVVVAASAEVTPTGDGTAAEVLSAGAAVADITQHLGRCPRRENQLTFSLYVQEHATKPAAVRLALADVETGADVGCVFTFASGAAVAGTPDTGVTAYSDGGTPWSRIAISVDLALATTLRPGYTVAVVVETDLAAAGDAGAHVWGAQCTLGATLLAHRTAGPRRMNPVPVCIEAPRWERQTGTAQRIASKLVEQVH